MKRIKQKAKEGQSGFVVAALFLASSSILLAACVWFLWFRDEGAPVPEDALREVEAFEAYERQKAR